MLNYQRVNDISLLQADHLSNIHRYHPVGRLDRDTTGEAAATERAIDGE